MRSRTLALTMVPLLGVVSCSAAADTSSVVGRDELTIGVKSEQPGLGWRNDDGTFEGFDVDVATYVAGKLGVAPGDITWRAVASAEREDVITSGEVDLVVATYSVTPERKTQVTFGGPYYVAHQDIMVRADNTDVEQVADLEEATLCQEEGSNSANRIIEERGIGAELQELPRYADCVEALAQGEVDAVSTDDLILAGFLAEDPSAFRFVNNPFTEEKYGVGLPHGDVRACEAVNKAISEMYQDGTAAELLDKWFGSTDLDVVESVPQFEGCD